MNQNPPAKHKYPFGTVAIYGPDDNLATKLVGAVFSKPGHPEPHQIQRWISSGGDIRTDPVIAHELAAFFKKHGVKESVISDRILGCPHEEGIDYPVGAVCPQCPFWATVDRFTHQPKLATPVPKPGRNEPCTCGSGKKYKKCCGAPK